MSEILLAIGIDPNKIKSLRINYSNTQPDEPYNLERMKNRERQMRSVENPRIGMSILYAILVAWDKSALTNNDDFPIAIESYHQLGVIHW